MPVTNALLIRTAYGWDEAVRDSSIDTHGRREALYGLGANNSPADVQATANARLDIIAEPRYQFDAEHRPPTDADWAYVGYGVGDSLPVTSPGGSPSSERVLSIAVSEDDKTGQSTVTASLHDVVMYASPIENFVAMLGQAVKKMIPGTGRGDWKEAQPVTPPAIPAPVSAWVPPPPVEVDLWTESFNGIDGATVGPDLAWLDTNGDPFPPSWSTPTHARLAGGELAIDTGVSPTFSADWFGYATNTLPTGSLAWFGEITFGNVAVASDQQASVNLRWGYNNSTGDDIANLQVHMDGATDEMSLTVWDYNDTSVLGTTTVPIPSGGDVLRFESHEDGSCVVLLNGVAVLTPAFGLAQRAWPEGLGLGVDFTFGFSAHAAGAVSIDSLSYGLL